MRKKLKPIAFLSFILSTILFTACSSNDDSNNSKESENTNLNLLKAVQFETKPDKVLASAKTGKTQLNPTTGTTEFEYLTSIEKQATLEPLSIVSASNSDVIYPGSIIRGSSFMSATYDPIVLQNKFNDITISMSLRGKDLPVSADVNPTKSGITNAMNIMLERNQQNINYDAVPAYYSYQSDEITNEQSFTKSLDAHLDVNVLAGLVKVNFGYSASSGSTNSKNYVLVKVRQQFYNFTVDPKHYSKWIEAPIQLSDLGTHEPLYISSVDYGRVAYLLIETNKDSSYNNTMVKASVGVALKVVNIGVDVNYSEEFKTLFSQNKIKVMIVGGPASLGGKVTSYNDFVKFLQTPDTKDLVSSAALISYKVRRLKDNTEVTVKESYTEQLKEFKIN